MTYRRTLTLLVCLMLLAFALRALSLDAQSMWRDEVDTLCFALDAWGMLERAVEGGEETGLNSTNASALSSSSQPHCQPTPGLSRVDPSEGLWSTLRGLLTLPGWNGPLYTVAMRPWVGLTGNSPFALRYSALIFGLLAVPLTYVLGRRTMGTGVGLVGATLVAVSPHLVWYSQEAKMYGIILALGLLAIYGTRRALDQTSGGSLRWWGVMVGATTLALYCHILTALLIPLQVVLGLIWWRRTRRHWRGALIALACLTLPYLPLLMWQVRNWLLPVGQATLFSSGRLDVMLEATFNGWGGHFVGEPWATLVLAGLAVLALFGLAGLWLMDEHTEVKAAVDGEGNALPYDWREPLALLAWMSVPLLGIWLISVRQPIFANRYLIWAAPAFYLLVAAGLAIAVRLGRGGALAAGGLFLLIFVGDGRALLYQARQPIKPDFRAAAAYLEERYHPSDLIVFHLSYMEGNFAFYYGGEYEGWGAPAPGNGMPESDVDFYMRTNTSGHGTVWLVLSEPEMWDPRGLVKAWLDAHALAPPEEQVFAHVSVYGYQLDG
ncbi:MAG: glycosyltransferase family 39 protein [Anaerolineae bacterium]|nr:MAG: glycosyltransferase family 39 protein [Anaerolineae bacterium]